MLLDWTNLLSSRDVCKQSMGAWLIHHNTCQSNEMAEVMHVVVNVHVGGIL
jgi:hypothetical protein